MLADLTGGTTIREPLSTLARTLANAARALSRMYSIDFIKDLTPAASQGKVYSLSNYGIKESKSGLTHRPFFDIDDSKNQTFERFIAEHFGRVKAQGRTLQSHPKDSTFRGPDPQGIVTSITDSVQYLNTATDVFDRDDCGVVDEVGNILMHVKVIDGIYCKTIKLA